MGRDQCADDLVVAVDNRNGQVVSLAQAEANRNPAAARGDDLSNLGREDRAALELQPLGDGEGRGRAAEQPDDEHDRQETRQSAASLDVGLLTQWKVRRRSLLLQGRRSVSSRAPQAVRATAQTISPARRIQFEPGGSINLIPLKMSTPASPSRSPSSGTLSARL